MQFQQKYDQALYNTMQLIRRRKFQRAIKLCQNLESQGITTTELTIIKSYAISHTKGYGKALDSIASLSTPLANIAKIQYQQMSGCFGGCIDLFDQVCVNSANNCIQQLKENNEVYCTADKATIQPAWTDGEFYRYVYEREKQVIQKVNLATDKFSIAKQKLAEQQITKDQFKKVCVEVRGQYANIAKQVSLKGKVGGLIDQYITFMDNLIGLE